MVLMHKPVQFQRLVLTAIVFYLTFSQLIFLARRASSVGHGRRPSILPEQAALNIPQEYVIRTVSNGREISSWCVNDVGVNDWYACDFVTACTFRWWDILAIHEPLRLLLLLAQSHLDNPKFPGPIEEKGWRVFNFFRWVCIIRFVYLYLV